MFPKGRPRTKIRHHFHLTCNSVADFLFGIPYALFIHKAACSYTIVYIFLHLGSRSRVASELCHLSTYACFLFCFRFYCIMTFIYGHSPTRTLWLRRSARAGQKCGDGFGVWE